MKNLKPSKTIKKVTKNTEKYQHWRNMTNNDRTKRKIELEINPPKFD